jgi:hypothetical protein
MKINYGSSKKSIAFGKPKVSKKDAIQYKSEGQDIEQDSLDEVNEVISSFSKRGEDEQKKFKDNVDANYFTVISFNNKEQLDEFLKKIKINVPDRQYINGLTLAKALGIEITSPSREAPGAFKASKRLKDLV